MRNDIPGAIPSAESNGPADPAYTRAVQAAWTLSVPKTPPEQPRRPSRMTHTLGPHSSPRRRSSLRLTDRDVAIVDAVFRMRALTADQLATALFPLAPNTRCQVRLRVLLAAHFLDRLPRQLVNEPAVYVLSRRSIAGNRLMRDRWGEAEFRRRMTRIGPLHHLLALNELRVRIERGCQDLGWSVPVWQTAEELAPILAGSHVIPDGYTKIQRMVDGEIKTAPLLVELELASKSSRVVADKLARVGNLFYSGRFRALLGSRALRVLIVFAGDPATAEARIRRGVEAAGKLGVTIARFTSLGEITAAGPSGCLTQPIWRAPAHERLISLF
jgi:hypothetical protein